MPAELRVIRPELVEQPKNDKVYNSRKELEDALHQLIDQYQLLSFESNRVENENEKHRFDQKIMNVEEQIQVLLVKAEKVLGKNISEMTGFHATVDQAIGNVNRAKQVRMNIGNTTAKFHRRLRAVAAGTPDIARDVGTVVGSGAGEFIDSTSKGLTDPAIHCLERLGQILGGLGGALWYGTQRGFGKVKGMAA